MTTARSLGLPASSVLDGLAHLGALGLVGHLVQPVEEENHAAPAVEQAGKEVARQAGRAVALDEIVGDEGGQRAVVRVAVALVLAAVAGVGAERDEDGQRQRVVAS